MKTITSHPAAAPLLSACWQNFLSLLLPDKPRRGRRRGAARVLNTSPRPAHHGAVARH